MVRLVIFHDDQASASSASMGQVRRVQGGRRQAQGQDERLEDGLQMPKT